MIPRLGDSPKRGQRYKARPGAYGILLRGKDVLLTEEYELEPEIQLPGGGIDPGESPVSALHREVMEETGWTISAPKRLGAFRRFAFMPEYDMWAEKICHIYVARPCMQVAEPTEKYHRSFWCSLRDAVDLLGNSGDRYFAARFLRSHQR